MSRNTSFYYSFLVLPHEKREALTAFFDFCRAVDDGVDLEKDQANARAAVALWREEIERLFTGGAPVRTETRALQSVVERFPLPRVEFEALVDGVSMDIDPVPFETFDELETYCHRVASSVGLVCAEIFGYRDPVVRDYARDLGVALQLTNILRDVGVDSANGRVYIPTHDLARFGCTADDVQRMARGKALTDERMRAVLDHHAARARVFFSHAVRALPRDEARAFLPAEIMRQIYWDLLARIERARFDVFRELIRVPRPRQALIAARAWWRGTRRA
jgi:phytoene synthase